MIGIIFNHNVHDDPYKQSAVNKGLDKLQAICDKLHEHLFVSWSRNGRSAFVGKHSDEFIVVHYTSDLTATDKTEIADSIKEILTLKKTEYREDELPEILIVFSKIPQSDCFYYNVKGDLK